MNASTGGKRGRPVAPSPKPVDPTPTALAPDDMGCDGLANIDDAAKFLGMSTKTIRRLVNGGNLPRHRPSYRVMIPWAALKRYAAQTNRT